MIQVVLDINNMEKWVELKSVLEHMDIDYIIQNTDAEVSFSKTERELLGRSEEDIKEGRVFGYTSHREILAK